MRFLAIVGGAFGLVFGGIRFYGWVSLQQAQKKFEHVFGSAASQAPLLPEGEQTTASAIAAALASLEADEEFVSTLSALAILPPRPFTAEQQQRAEQMLAAQAPALAALATLPERPVGRLGRWKHIEPEEEGRLQAGLLLLAELVVVEGRLACERGDGERFQWALAALGGLAAGLEREGASQPLVLGLMIEHLQHVLLARGLWAGLGTGAAAERLAAMLGQVDLRLAYRQVLASQVDRLLALRTPWSIRQVRAWLADLVYFDLWLARGLEALIEQAGELDRPLLSQMVAIGSLSELSSVTAAGAVSLPLRVQLGMAGRALAQAALAVWQHAAAAGAYPRELVAVPKAVAALEGVGVPVRFERQGDGSARLFVPGAAEALRALGNDPESPTLLVWELPPLHR